MTSANFRDEPTTEVLDLYDALPQADRTPARTEDDPVTTMIKGVGRNLAAIIGMFAVYLPAFILCTTLFSLGVGLIILGVGLIILVAALVVAGWSARMSRSLLAYAGHELRRCTTPRRDLECEANCADWATLSPGGTCCTSWSTSYWPRSRSRWR